jgi:hypothetical protein
MEHKIVDGSDHWRIKEKPKEMYVILIGCSGKDRKVIAFFLHRCPQRGGVITCVVIMSANLIVINSQASVMRMHMTFSQRVEEGLSSSN